MDMDICYARVRKPLVCWINILCLMRNRPGLIAMKEEQFSKQSAHTARLPMKSPKACASSLSFYDDTSDAGFYDIGLSLKKGFKTRWIQDVMTIMQLPATADSRQ